MKRDELLQHTEQCLAGLREFMQQASQSEPSQHLRTSGAELLKAVRSGLDMIIDALEPEVSAPVAPCCNQGDNV